MNITSKKRMNLINKFSIGNKTTFCLAIIFAMLNTIFFSFVPQVVRITIDSVIGYEEFILPKFLLDYLNMLGGREFLQQNLYICGMFVLFITAISGIFNFLSRIKLSQASEGFIKNLRDTLYSHISKLPLSWHIKHQTGDIIQRATSDTETIKRFTSIQLYEILKVSFLIIFTMFLMFSMNVTLAFISFIFIPISLAYSNIFFKKISKKFTIADEKEGELSSVVQENLTGVRVVRAFGREAYELKRFDKANNSFADTWIEIAHLNGYYWGGGEFITSSQILTVILFATIFAVDNKITAGEFVAFVSYNASLIWPIRTLGRMIVDMSKTFVAIDRISYILDAEEEKDNIKLDTLGLIDKPEILGDIEFKNVNFSYEEGNPILKNLNFIIEQGTTFGILGKTGSGKSTLIQLINRLYELDKNSDIIIAGTSIKNMKLSYLRENIGVVFGEPFLFSKSILDNISITNNNFNKQDVEEVSKIASIHETIKGFKYGYDTIIGERGVTLSGGQKQRIAIARTLIQKTPIIIFDDSLSAVDTETDAKIRQALKENLSGSTVILVSHRITTLMEADKILVLEDGEVTTIGTHQELINKEGIYKDIYLIQTSSNTKYNDDSTNKVSEV